MLIRVLSSKHCCAHAGRHRAVPVSRAGHQFGHSVLNDP